MIWPSDAAILALAMPLVKRWEALRLSPYRCPAGFPTIGYGARFYPGGRAVAMEDRAITPGEADAFLAHTLRVVLARLKRSIARVPAAHQGAAMLSLAYNIGEGNFARSTLLAEFNAGDIAGACAEFPKWCHAHAGGKLVVLEGLRQRRQAEAALFLTPDN
jgi:lysozyme